MNTGDSRSWTSLSIWMSMFTVISNSALQSISKEQGSLRFQLLTKFEEDCMLARTPEQAGIRRRLLLNYGTMT